ncbi:conjugative transposon membrane protein [Streptococcus pyogenes]|nr:Maff2 family protein [Streptococcus pyogenes]VGV87910.1 conjugative transposon membrane protein [Streptococcus pyogenes]
MEFFTQAVNVLKILVMAVGAGLGEWGVINLMEGYGNDNRATRS